MYYTVIDENCQTCGHKHRRYNRAVDCYDNLIDFTSCINDEPVILEVKRPIPLEEAGFLRAAWEKYGSGEEFQEFADKWLGVN
jgi:hypothetical protein